MFVLVGVGAPISVFLRDVAKLLGTTAVIPEIHGVANALGAIVGNINVTSTVEILPDTSADGTSDFLVYGSEGKMSFEDMSEAVRYAKAEAEKLALAEAKRRGAKGEIQVSSEVYANEAAAKDGAVYLGTHVIAHASGTMGF